MKTIIIVEHYQMPEIDRGKQHLAARGFRIHRAAPHLGEPLPDLDADTAGVIVMGGPQYVTQLEEFPYLRDEMGFIDKVMKRDMPLLGICLGAQLIALHLGAHVGNHSNGSAAFGYYKLRPAGTEHDFIPDDFHAPAANLQGFELPRSAVPLATGDLFPNQAYRIGPRTYGFQFHPEVTRPILDSWQNRFASRFGKNGAHSRAQQDADFARYDKGLDDWYTGFLDKFFGP